MTEELSLVLVEQEDRNEKLNKLVEQFVILEKQIDKALLRIRERRQRSGRG